MCLKSFLDIYDVFYIDEYGNFAINRKKLLVSSIISFFIVILFATLIMISLDYIFPEEIVYVNLWHSNDTAYHIGINASTDHFANNFIKGVFLVLQS